MYIMRIYAIEFLCHFYCLLFKMAKNPLFMGFDS